MVDFLKRAAKSGDLDPDEQVLGAVNVLASPFVVANAGMTGGLIAGGVVGAAVGAAWDRRRRKADEADAATKPLPEIAARSVFEPGIPANGALLAVTSKRILMWNISAMGKPKGVLATIDLADVDQVYWEDVGSKWLRGSPASLMVWLGVHDAVLAMAAISLGPAGKYATGLVAALEQRLPGKVQEFSG